MLGGACASGRCVGGSWGRCGRVYSLRAWWWYEGLTEASLLGVRSCRSHVGRSRAGCCERAMRLRAVWRWGVVVCFRGRVVCALSCSLPCV